MTVLTTEDRELLSRTLHAMITVAPRGERWPAPRPVWFELAANDTIQIFSFASAQRVKQLRTIPRASIVVAAPVREPERWVSLEGSVTLHHDGAHELSERLADRYYEDPRKKSAVLHEWRAEELVRIVVAPDRVQRYANG